MSKCKLSVSLLSFQMSYNVGTYTQSQIAGPEYSGLSGKMHTENHCCRYWVADVNGSFLLLAKIIHTFIILPIILDLKCYFFSKFKSM